MGTSLLRSSVVAFSFVGLSSVAACKPCECPAVAAPSAAGAPAPAAGTPEAATVSVSGPITVWDGEGTDDRAKGWANCQEGTGCTATLEAKPEVGRGGGKGLEFKAKAAQWAGFGWNWFGWWPENAGTDISKEKSLHFWIKVTAEAGKKKPDAGTVTIHLEGSSKAGKDVTADAKLVDYVPNFLDGEWHEATVPLDPMLRGTGETFDTKHAWGISVGSWNADEREYTVVIDDVGFL